ncbi:MAG: bifunctional folylpolyglutamate synthase/ dihydrofolate synthase [Deltaproteobacteria bacterium]|jgi:dihydrofolate synthase/folylpolyglutamate synthase|nr:bifunctional folylpolyglutamate synthase/ dihydrofolate synthase [Deltaproteobacteria bacterium]
MREGKRGKRACQQGKFGLWRDFEQYLEQLGLFRMRPGLERMAAVLSRLGLKRPPFFVVQGVGTNAKGSCCTFLASLARSHGLLCGLHTSPHFLSVRERIRLFKPSAYAGTYSGELLPEAAWLEAAGAVLAHGGENLTYFELVTAMSVFMFREAKVEAAIMETGLGGRFDATTALDADVVFFTPIAVDHGDILGFSLRGIAGDKALAMRGGKPAFSAAQRPEVRAELENVAANLEVPLAFCPGADFLPPALLPPVKEDAAGGKDSVRTGSAEVPLALRGRHQLDNAALSLFTWRAMRPLLGVREDQEAEIRGLAQAGIAGRLQFIAALPAAQGNLPHPPVILDGGHNPHALAALGHSLALLNIAPLVTVFTCLKDKQPDSLAPHLRVLAPGLILTVQLAGNPRAMDAEELARLIGPQAKPAASMAEAIRLANAEFAGRLPEALNMDMNTCRRPLLVCGSLYLLAEFYRLYPHYLEGGEVIFTPVTTVQA